MPQNALFIAKLGFLFEHGARAEHLSNGEKPAVRRMRASIGRGAFALKAIAGAALIALSMGGTDALGDGLASLKQPRGAVTASAAQLEPTPQGGVVLKLALSQKVDTHAFTLNGPERIVVDFPEINWGFDPASVVAQAPPAVRARGVKALRVGLFRMGRSRMVLDVEAPMTRGAVRFAAASSGAGSVLLLELKPTAAASVGERAEARLAEAAKSAENAGSEQGLARRAAALAFETGATPPGAVEKIDVLARAGLSENWPGLRNAAPAPRPRPRMTVIAVDAGHGGGDPGARYGGMKEKHLVLKVAKLLRGELERLPRVKVVMTRKDDRYIELKDRVKIARDAGADLFVSLHADALKEHPEVAGASFYTLSDRASDALAARLAKNENASFANESGFQSENPWVRRLLVDYAQRRQVAGAHHLVEGMVKSFRANRVPLIKSRPHREAGFKVLKNFDQPSLLIELGFLTNIRDQRRFTNPAWRETAAKAIAGAIERWIDDRNAPAQAGDIVMRAAAAEAR